MARISGTILSIGDLLKNDRTSVKIYSGEEIYSVITLSEGRVYTIPDYQREIRWTKENVVELISDLSRGWKFLGNIILNEKSKGNYEIIDGQQRITVLLMIIQFIRFRYDEELDHFTVCELQNQNFNRFKEFKECNFILDNCKNQNEIIKSDKLNQRERYLELWNLLKALESFSTTSRVASLLDNIKKSQVNLILSKDDTENYSIGYFLDVNLKGVKLDTEDIFKGYLFSIDSSENIRTLWNQFKFLSEKLNKICKYPLMKLIEHYMYCDLYKKQEFKGLKFNQEFLINEIKINGEYHYAGEHIIRTIHNKTYMQKTFENINEFIEFILSAVESESLSVDFKKYFKSKEKLDHDVLTIIHSLIIKIIRDNNVVPKLLIMKFFTDVILKENVLKKEYNVIYSIYTLSVMFTIFESKKNIEKMNDIAKSEDWTSLLLKHSQSYFDTSKLSNSKIRMSYKILEDIDTVEDQMIFNLQMYRAKTLATIYNYFEVMDNRIVIKKGLTKKLKDFVSNSKKYSVEHFVINKSGKYKESGKMISYPRTIKNYKESLFNFIFIDEDLNRDLEYMEIDKKLRLINEKLIEEPGIIECEYSKLIIDLCNKEFPEGIDEETFCDKFYEIAVEVICKIGERLKFINTNPNRG